MLKDFNNVRNWVEFLVSELDLGWFFNFGLVWEKWDKFWNLLGHLLTLNHFSFEWLCIYFMNNNLALFDYSFLHMRRPLLSNMWRIWRNWVLRSQSFSQIVFFSLLKSLIVWSNIFRKLLFRGTFFCML